MSVEFNVGINTNISDSFKAGFEAATTALDGITTPEKLLFVFASSVFDQDNLLKGVHQAAPGASIIGSSTAGEITQSGQTHKSVVVVAIGTQKKEWTTAFHEGVLGDDQASAQALGEDLITKMPDMKAMVVFQDILSGNGAAMVRGMQEACGEKFPIMGGASGDDFVFKKTYQYHNEKVVSNALCAVGISDEIAMGVGIGHGWKPVGLPMKITKAKGTIVHEIDGKPAANVYKEYFGEQHAAVMETEPLARLAITYPLGLKENDQSEYLVSAPLSINPDDGSVTCAAEMPMGKEVRLMMSNKDDAVAAARTAAEKLREDFHKQGAVLRGVLVFNCIAREKLFGREGDVELQAISEVIGTDIPFAGFYTYGEIGPLSGIGDVANLSPSRFHNETVVLLGVGEKG